MKSLTKCLVFLLLAALPFSLFGQTTTVIAAFMKVTPGQTSEYLEVEQAWKKMHQRAVEEGVYNSWQLWRKLHAGDNDPYDYVTLQWYENYETSFGENVNYDWMNEVYGEEEWAEIMNKTTASRSYSNEEVYHLAVTVDNPQPVKYLVLMRNHIPPDRRTEYFKMEREIFKPYQEEMIRREALAQWGIWNAWPYKDGQPQVVIAEGYKDAKQLTTSVDGDEVLSVVHPEMNWEDLIVEINKNREQVSVEIWELVDFVIPEQVPE